MTRAEFSSADLATLDALVKCHLETNQAVRDLARAIAAKAGIQLSQPQQSAQPRTRGRHRCGNVIRHGPGHLTADVVNDEER